MAKFGKHRVKDKVLEGIALIFVDYKIHENEFHYNTMFRKLGQA